MNYNHTWDQAMTYQAYRDRIEALLLENRHTGAEQQESLLEYSKLNVHRMNRLDKTVVVSTELKETLSDLKDEVRFMVITEGWCGDAAQIVPVLAKVGEESGAAVRFILRDEHPEVMNLHLTNGAKSIPIVLALDPDGRVRGQWGPRPAVLQKMVMDYKNAPEPKEPYSEFSKKTQLWYANDKQSGMQSEWLDWAKNWKVLYA